MIHINWLLSLAIFIQNSVCNNDILSKLHQNSYKLKDTRIELISYNKSYYNFFTIKAFKYNRTTTAHNVTFKFKVDMEDNTEVIIQAYKFLSNEYRHFPVHFQANLQKCFKSNAIGLHALDKCGNLTSFYFHKDIIYHACNFVIDEKQFPPLVPNGRYKIELTLYLLNKEISVMHIFAEVYTPMAYPKK